MTAVNEALQAAVVAHQLALPDDKLLLLDRYCRALWQRNEQLNLTRHTDYQKFVSRDLVDCFQLSQLLNERERVLDVGSGGGVPGVVLAILRPDLDLALCESVGKKAAALADIVQALSLDCPVVAARAEHFLDAERPFDTLVARAVGPLWKMLKWFEPHWNSIGRLLAIKGPRWAEERGEARHRGYLKPLELRRVATYPMPGTGSQSVILQIKPKHN